jgi:thiol-activated cytolysin
MKTFRLLSILVLTTILLSCDNEIQEAEQQLNKMGDFEYSLKDIEIPSTSLDWDISYHPESTTRSGGVNESYEFAAVNTAAVFTGGVYTLESIGTLDFVPLVGNPPAKSIDVAYTFPGGYIDNIQRPSYVSCFASFMRALASPNFSGKQLQEFEYDAREFSDYRETKLAFGANVNVASIFKLDASVDNTKIKAKSGLFARVLQKNFSVIMDYPLNGNIFLNENELERNKAKNPVYINSIIYGRMAIIAIESDESYSSLRTALNASLSLPKVNGELNISAKDSTVLSNSQIKVYAWGGKANDVVKLVEGFGAFKEYLINGGEFSREVPGIPILFTANYASTNGVVKTTFTTIDD